MTTYLTRNEAIHREIIEPIEAGAAHRWEFDIDAIADELIVTDENNRFHLDEDADFWDTVAKHETEPEIDVLTIARDAKKAQRSDCTITTTHDGTVVITRTDGRSLHLADDSTIEDGPGYSYCIYDADGEEETSDGGTDEFWCHRDIVSFLVG